MQHWTGAPHEHSKQAGESRYWASASPARAGLLCQSPSTASTRVAERALPHTRTAALSDCERRFKNTGASIQLPSSCGPRTAARSARNIRGAALPLLGPAPALEATGSAQLFSPFVKGLRKLHAKRALADQNVPNSKIIVIMIMIMIMVMVMVMVMVMIITQPAQPWHGHEPTSLASR
ncbi:uncharacterized protein WM277_015892 isoform 1-T3 [Molossus nigricans]